MRVLDFDIENRPSTYWYPGATTAEVTAIAWAWVDAPDEVTCLHIPTTMPSAMLWQFCLAYDQADMVTGHNIRRHDLPHVNAALIEFGLPPLKPKLTSDTLRDLPKMADFSRSQATLAELFRVRADKRELSQMEWRAINRLEPAGLELLRERVIGDVKQHMQLREVMLKRNLLGQPRMWNPGGGSRHRALLSRRSATVPA